MKIVKKLLLICLFFILLMGNFTRVFGAEDVQIKITPNTKELTTSDIILIIEIASTKMFDSSSTQGVQILVGEISATNNWSDLGTGKNGVALKKSYNYIVKENSNITIRVVSWTNEDRSDLTEIATQKIQIGNIDKTNPIIEKIDASATENSIALNVVAKDNESGISKYSCSCATINYNKTQDTSKFDITGLEANKEYEFTLSVEDKVGNKTAITKTVKVKEANAVANKATQTPAEQPTNSVETNSTTEETVQDTTVANKILPQVGTKNIVIVGSIVSVISLIYIFNKR